MFADRIRFEPLISFDEAVARIAAVTGVVLVCGATDSGKTTLVLAAMNAAIRAGRRVAVLDTDPGQGEVGPPGTLGLTVPSDPVASLSERKPEALAFLGDITPAGHTLTLVQGACRLLHAGSARDAELVLIDTTGAVEGRWAEVLKLTKAAALRPVQIVLLHRGTELSRLARLFAGLLEAEILHVRSPAEARPRSPAYRKLMREARLRRHLKEARTHVLDAPALTVAGAWLYTGESLPAVRLHAAEAALGTRVLHGERVGDGIFLCTERRPTGPAGEDTTLRELFGRRRVTITPGDLLPGLLVGLTAEGGRLVEIGVLRGIQFDRALISILAPTRTVEDVVLLQFGRLRVSPEGAELGRLQPGEL